MPATPLALTAPELVRLFPGFDPARHAGLLDAPDAPQAYGQPGDESFVIIWPVDRAAMVTKVWLRARMASEALDLVDIEMVEGGCDPSLSEARLVRLGWTREQLELHGYGVVGLVTSALNSERGKVNRAARFARHQRQFSHFHNSAADCVAFAFFFASALAAIGVGSMI